MNNRRLLALVVASVVALWATAGGADADQVQYQYKFPCYWGGSCWVTQLAHGTPSALDFDPLGSAGLGDIPSMAEGTVTFVDASTTSCTYYHGVHGYGIHAIVSDFHGQSPLYAHLSSVGVTEDTQVLQGDRLGQEGNTGYSAACAPHLHWQPDGLPAYINSVPLWTLTLGDRQASNTNSVIGEYSAYGLALRTYYTAHGGWANIGWTHKHCPGTCTLDMTANKTWGRMQDFQHDVDFLGGEFDTIQVPVWDQAHAFLVDSIFWQAWAAGGPDSSGLPHPIGMATTERGSCPAGSSPACIGYQKFHVGFVWMDQYATRQAIFCPDLNGDQRVTLAELIIEAGQYELPPVPPAVEITGDNYKVDLADLIAISSVYLVDCHR